ncbi:MAG: hypothetical protein Q8Q92_05095, partial [bacterium]|nr:hypothetical protein [bacterium]
TKKRVSFWDYALFATLATIVMSTIIIGVVTLESKSKLAITGIGFTDADGVKNRLDVIKDEFSEVEVGKNRELLRFTVRTSGSPSLEVEVEEVGFGFFYDSKGSPARVENFRLFQGDVLISGGENLNPQNVRFGESDQYGNGNMSIGVQPNSDTTFSIVADISGKGKMDRIFSVLISMKPLVLYDHHEKARTIKIKEVK